MVNGQMRRRRLWGRVGRIPLQIAIGVLLLASPSAEAAGVANGGLGTLRAAALTTRIFTCAGNGGYTIDAAPGPRDGARATAVQVKAPSDVALAADGSIIFAEGISGAVRRIGPDGRDIDIDNLSKRLLFGSHPLAMKIATPSSRCDVFRAANGCASMLKTLARFASSPSVPSRAPSRRPAMTASMSWMVSPAT